MSYHHLTPYERARLDILYKKGYSIRTIAIKLSRNPSTISRELRRFSGQRYEAEMAQQYIKRRKHVGRKGKISTELIDLIEDKLKATWSPEQIVGRLLLGKICFKTIYR